MNYEEKLAKCLQDILDAFWDMSPLEYAHSRGLSHMSDTVGETLLNNARKVLRERNSQVSKEEIMEKTYQDFDKLKEALRKVDIILKEYQDTQP